MAKLKKGNNPQRLPNFNGFTPLGLQHPRVMHDTLISYREYEAFVLCNLGQLSAPEVSDILHISLKSLYEINKNVMKKIVTAFVEGNEIHFGENNINIANWYECKFCGISFTVTSVSGAVCPFCKTSLLKLN